MDNQDFSNISADDITPELVADLKKNLVAAAGVCKAACTAYREDITARDANLTRQAAEYAAALEKAKGQRKNLAAKVADYTSRGMIDEAAKIDAKVEDLDRQVTTLGRKLRLVKSAQVKGDRQLYEAAQTAYQAVEAEKAQYIGKLNQLRDIAKAEIERLKKLIENINLNARVDHTGAVYNDFQKVDRHYRDLDRMEQEARERAAAEQKAAAEARKGTHYSFTGDSATTKTVDPEVVAAREQREREAKERTEAIKRQNEAANNSDGARRYVLA